MQNVLLFGECLCFILRFILSVFPTNDSELVDKIGELLGADLDQLMTLTNTDEDAKKKHPFPCPCTYRYLNEKSAPTKHHSLLCQAAICKLVLNSNRFPISSQNGVDPLFGYQQSSANERFTRAFRSRLRSRGSRQTEKDGQRNGQGRVQRMGRRICQVQIL